MHIDSKQTILPDVVVKQNATIIWKCVICGKIIDEDVQQHRRIHSRKNDRICDICGKTFKQYTNWWSHMRRHDAIKAGKPFQCQLCPKSFSMREDLRKHVVIHSKVRPHVCEVCGKSFKQRHCLSRHRHTHQDFKPLTCEFCGKGFSNNYNLKGHLRTHTGEKPFQCDLCKAAFTHNVSLKTHKKSAHGIDMWKDQQTSAATECDDTKGQSVPNHPSTTEGVKPQSDLSTVKRPIAMEGSTDSKASTSAHSFLLDKDGRAILSKTSEAFATNAQPCMRYANPISSLIHAANVCEPNSAPHDVLAPPGPSTGYISSGVPDFSMLHREPQYWPHIDGTGRSFTKL